METEKYFRKLFEPGQIGKVRIKNRIVMAPMGGTFWTEDGRLTDKTIDYFVARAKGGVGLIRVAVANVDFPPGTSFLECDMGDNWETIARHFDMIEQIHFYGAKVALQMTHSGKQTTGLATQPVSCSPIPCVWLKEKPYPVPRALERGEIYRLIDQHAYVAVNAKRAGYDMVELHGAHGYMINAFMSPYFNKRADEFGGSLKNRMRFPIEIIKRIKEKVGDDYPVGIRISGDEFLDGGITVEESPAMAHMLEEAGVAYIGASSGTYETLNKSNDTMRLPEGWKSYIWEAVKRGVKIPTFAEGGNRSPEFCEKILLEGKADFVTLGRQLLADPEWPNKIAQGKTDEIRKCISCLECLGATSNRVMSTRCAVNVAVGREKQFGEIQPAHIKKKVMVIGAGPAGMEAARIAALRGHQVTLCDKRPELGGQLLLAAIPPGKDKLLWIRDYYKSQLPKLGVKMELGTEVTLNLVEKEKPDAVIVATGSEPIIPNIPGIRNKRVVTALDVLGGKVKITNQKVAIAGGGMVGCETAEFLADQGNTVTIVEMLPDIALDMEPLNRKDLIGELKKKSIKTLTGCEVREVSDKGLVVTDKSNEERQVVEADWVVLAMGANPVEPLANVLEGTVSNLYRVGDCREVRTILSAIYEGAAAGVAI